MKIKYPLTEPFGSVRDIKTQFEGKISKTQMMDFQK